MFNLFKKMPIILGFIIIIVIGIGNKIPLETAQMLYGISLSIKSFIIFILPALIFILLFNAAVNLSKDASKIILLIISGVVISNFITTSLAGFIGQWVYSFDMNLIQPEAGEGLEGARYVLFPSVVPNQYALFAGIIAGLIFGKHRPNDQDFLFNLERAVNKMLFLITILIPFFVAGFVVKLQKDGVIVDIMQQYSAVLFIIMLSLFSYIFLLYQFVNRFRTYWTLVTIKNMLPATISGFSTMSSAASMPLTILGVDTEAENKDLAHTVVPASVNIHLIGDCIAIPCFAYAILKNYGMPVPDLQSYFIFTIFFVLAKFSVAAVPGGGVLVMLPILEQYLGFNAEMLTLITALYILFDPFITSMNILGNGAFALIIDKFWPQNIDLSEEIYVPSAEEDRLAAEYYAAQQEDSEDYDDKDEDDDDPRFNSDPKARLDR